MVNVSALIAAIGLAFFSNIMAVCKSGSCVQAAGLTNHFIAIATAKNFILLSLIFRVVRAAGRFNAFGFF